jgi:hypothetical protein
MQSIPIDVMVSSFEEAVEDSNEVTAENTNVLTQLIDRIEIFTKAQDQNNTDMPSDMAALLRSDKNNSSTSGTVTNDSDNRNEKEQEKKNKDEMDSLLKKDIEEKKTERGKKDIYREEEKIFRKEVNNKFTDVALAGTAVLVGIPVLFKHLEDMRGYLLPHIDTLVDTVKMGFDPSNPNNMATRLGDFLNVKVSEIGKNLSNSNNPILSGLGGALYNATGGEMRDTTNEIQQLNFLKDEVQKYYQSGNKDVSLNLLQQYQNREEGNLLGTEPMRLLALQKNAQAMYEAINEASLPSEVIKSQANTAINLRNQGNDEGYKNMRKNLIKEIKKDRMNITDNQAEQAVDMLLSGFWTDFENTYEVSKESYDRGDIEGVTSVWDVFAEKSGDNKRMPKVMRNLLDKEGRYAEDFTYDYMIANKLMTPDEYVRYMNQYLQSVVNDKYFEPYEEVNRILEEAVVSEMSTAEYNRMKHQQEGEEWSKGREHYLLKDMLRRGAMSTAEWAGVPEETKQALESQGYGPYISRIGENWRSQTYEASVGVTQSVNKLANDAIGVGINVQELEKYSPSLAGWIQSMGVQTLPEYILNEIKQRTSEESKPVMITNNISQSAPPVGSATTPR